MRQRTAVVAVAVFGATFVSFTRAPAPQASLGRREPKLIVVDAYPDVVSAADARTEASPLAEVTFVIHAVNTGERVTVHCPAPTFQPDAASLAEARRVMRAILPDDEGPIDPRLVVLLGDIARATGGPIELVSARRRPAWRGDHNFHVRGQAADIRVPGWSTSRLRAVAKAVGAGGIGVYPVSKMVHVDVRDVPFSWTDWSGPSR